MGIGKLWGGGRAVLCTSQLCGMYSTALISRSVPSESLKAKDGLWVSAKYLGSPWNGRRPRAAHMPRTQPGAMADTLRLPCAAMALMQRTVVCLQRCRRSSTRRWGGRRRAVPPFCICHPGGWTRTGGRGMRREHCCGK